MTQQAGRRHSRSHGIGRGSPEPALIFGVATLLGLFSTFQAYQVSRFYADKPTLLLAPRSASNFGYWYVWAAARARSCCGWRGASRFERGVWLRSLPVHLVGVVVVTVVHIGACTKAALRLMASSFWTEPMKVRHHVVEPRHARYLQSFDWEMMTYWAIVGAHHAVSLLPQAQERALKASRLETQLAEAQLQALQRQLHPHFLFNTLNAISALMHRDVEAADQMLSKLSDLLRIALDQRGAQEVALKDELEFLRSTSRSSRRGSVTASRWTSPSSRRRWTRRCRTLSFSHSSKTVFATRSPCASSRATSP